MSHRREQVEPALVVVLVVLPSIVSLLDSVLVSLLDIVLISLLDSVFIALLDRVTYSVAWQRTYRVGFRRTCTRTAYSRRPGGRSGNACRVRGGRPTWASRVHRVAIAVHKAADELERANEMACCLTYFARLHEPLAFEVDTCKWHVSHIVGCNWRQDENNRA